VTTTSPSTGEHLVRLKMSDAGLDPTAIEVFCAHLSALQQGGLGQVPESTIDPLEDVASVKETSATSSSRADTDALARTALLKLNGGLGTSMGLDAAKSLLPVRGGRTFLDLIADQVRTARAAYDVPLPLIFLHSFRTSADCLAALEAHPDLVAAGLPVELVQNRVPKLRADDLTPVSHSLEPSLEWCPPGHGDLYTVMHSSGVLDAMLDRGFTQLFVSNADNLAAAPDPHIAAWFAASGSPFAIEAVRRTPADRKGGHFARRREDGRIVLRETAQTPNDDLPALADLSRHRLASTNNLWMDIRAVRDLLRERRGVLDLSLIRNVKTVDPMDPSSTTVVQAETAVGAAIELFDDARVLEVERTRFLPVKTTDDLLLLRSDCIRFDELSRPVQRSGGLPFVALGTAYRLLDDFERRFAAGPPSLVEADSLTVEGDWTFGADVRVRGSALLPPRTGRVPDGTVLGEPS
jgi:UTP--glucose-1-phosphate uridylyltransferase